MIRSYLIKYSRVNQAMQTVSIMAKVGLSIVLPAESLQQPIRCQNYWSWPIRELTLYCNTSRVLIVMPTIDTATNTVERTEMT